MPDGAGAPTGTPLADPPLLELMSHDPVLRGVKMIAEAWDCDGLNQARGVRRDAVLCASLSTLPRLLVCFFLLHNLMPLRVTELSMAAMCLLPRYNRQNPHFLRLHAHAPTVMPLLTQLCTLP